MGPSTCNIWPATHLKILKKISHIYLGLIDLPPSAKTNSCYIASIVNPRKPDVVVVGMECQGPGPREPATQGTLHRPMCYLPTDGPSHVLCDTGHTQVLCGYPQDPCEVGPVLTHLGGRQL